MTTNQTIDGVPRELLERALLDAQRVRFATDKQVIELRALLDAPTPTSTPVVVAWMRFDDDQKAIFTRSKRANKSEPLYAHPTAYRHTAPAAQPQEETPNDDKSHPRFIAGYTAGLYDHKLGQPQGEPVAWICHGPEGSGLVALQWSHLPTPKGMVRKIGLCAEQPAPVAVDEEAEFTKWTHQVIAETKHQGLTVKIQRQQHLSVSEHKAALDAWIYRASLGAPASRK